MYRSTVVKLPAPEFYVLYNGKKPSENRVLKLSDSFEASCDVFQAEILVRVININYDKLDGTTLKDCRVLSDYAQVIETVRKYGGDIETAIRECIKENILTEYLNHYGSEVVNMLFEEYDAERAMQIREQEVREEAMAKGRAEGRAEGRTEGILRALVGLVKDGLLSISEAAKRADMTVEDFEKQYAALT